MTAATLIPAWVGEELRPFDKLQAHRDGLRHKAVSVFLHAGDKILLQQRALGSQQALIGAQQLLKQARLGSQGTQDGRAQPGPASRPRSWYVGSEGS